MKKTPQGFTAVCQCGKTIGALDMPRTESREASKILGTWLHGGCSVIPFFSETFSVQIEVCTCSNQSEGGAA